MLQHPSLRFPELPSPRFATQRAFDTAVRAAGFGARWLADKLTHLETQAEHSDPRPAGAGVEGAEAQARDPIARVMFSREVDGIRQVTEYVRHTVFGRPSRTSASPVVTTQHADSAPAGAPIVDAPEGERAVKVDPALWHVRYTVERRLDQLRRFQHFDLATDPVEAVHDFRVASRALRAYLDLFEPFLTTMDARELRRRLRQSTRAVGQLREWDVHVEAIRGLLAGTEDALERAALEHVLSRVARRRDKVERRARRKVRRIDLREVRGDMRDALDESLRYAASGPGRLGLMAWLGLEPTLQAAAEAARTCESEDRPLELHALRILSKRLRYSVELFEPAFFDAYRALHSPLKRLQELLGDHHDRVVLLELLEKEQAALSERQHLTLLGGLAPVIERVRADRQRLFEKFQTHHQRFDFASVTALAARALGPAKA